MEKLISDADLSRFNSFIKGPAGGTYHVIDDSLPSIEALFPQHVYYAILFKHVPSSTIGHWVTLIRYSDTNFEYFDCLGDPPPPVVLDRLQDYGLLQGVTPTLHRNSRSLMAPNGILCGKWVMLRLLALPHPLREFNEFFDRKGKLTPDQVVNFLINIPYAETSPE